MVGRGGLWDDQKRAHVFVSGRVQGVFFRSSTREHARQAGLRGWVKNRSDGRVEAIFEGPVDAVQRLVSWCHNGPPAAQVEHVEVNWEEPTGKEGWFDVRG